MHAECCDATACLVCETPINITCKTIDIGVLIFFDRGSLAYSFLAFLLVFFFNSVHLHGCCLACLFFSIMTVYLFVLRLLYFLEMWKSAFSLSSIVALWLTWIHCMKYLILLCKQRDCVLFRFILDLIKHARTRGEKQYKRDEDEYLNSKTNEFFLAHKYTSCESKSYFFKYSVKLFLIWSQISVLLLLLKAMWD